MAQFTLRETSITRDEALGQIKANLKARSDRKWSVTGGRGTAWGWLTITAPLARRNDYGSMTDDDATELARLLGLPYAHHQGVMVAASHNYYAEYIDRSAGRTPSRIAQPYWD